MSLCDDDPLVPPHLVRQVPELGHLANLLTCPICYEPAHLPAITPCHHLFCSLCIRKFLQYKQVCPSCHSELHESSLRQDKTAERLMELIRPLAARVDKIQTRALTDSASIVNQTGKENVKPLDAVFSTTSSRVLNNHKEPLSSSNSSSSTENQKTPCPVCSVPIPKKNLKAHQEKCGNVTKGRTDPPPIKRKPPPKALPKLVYNLLTETQLKKKCKEFGVNAKGEKSLLMKRLQKYTLLFNTEILLEIPRSPLQIAMQVEKEEKEEKAAKVTRLEVLQYDRNSKTELIEEKQKAYMTENRSSFANLIQKSKDRREKTINQENTVNPPKPETKLEEATGVCVPDAVEDKNVIDDDLDNLDEIPEMSNANNEVTRLLTDDDNDFIVAPPTNKRKSSPIVQKRNTSKRTKLKSEAQRKPSTPTKPTASQNIFAKLTQSAEQRKINPKVNCPVCSVQVPEKFLNIHLDKCLQSGAGGSSGSRSSSQKPKIEKRDSIKKHLVNKETDDEMVTTDEEEIDLDLSQEEKTRDAFTANLPARDKRTRTVVRPPIVESQAVDKENPEQTTSDLSSDFPSRSIKRMRKLAKHSIVESQGVNDQTKQISDPDPSPPSSPILDRYTETISQSQGPVIERQQSEQDMFAASDDEDRVSTVSSNLLDIDRHIEDMMEVALKDHRETAESETQSSSGSQARPRRKREGTKHVSVSVVPKVRQSKASTSKADMSSENSEMKRKTRRTAKKTVQNSDMN